ANQDEAGMYQARNRLSPRKIVTLAVPDLFGGTEDNVFSRLLLKSQPEAEGNIWNRMLLGELGSVFNRAWGYIGLIPLLLSLIGSAGWRKEPHTRIWTVLGWGTLGLLVLLGIGSAHRLLSGFWKTIDVLDHTRAIYFTVLSLSVLSGFGYDRFQTGDLSEKAAKIAIGFGILILALIAGGMMAGSIFGDAIVRAGLAHLKTYATEFPYNQNRPPFYEEGIQRIPGMIRSTIPILYNPVLQLLGFGCAALLAIRGKLSRNFFAMIILLLTITDLGYHGMNDPPLLFAAREQLYPLVGAPLSQLDSTNYRTMELQSRKLDVELPLEHYDQLGIYRRRGNRYFDFDAFDFVGRADSLMPYRIPSASGYLSLYPARYQQLWSGRPNDNLQFLKPGESCDRYAGGWIDMQSIRYILTAPGTNSDKFQKIYDGPDLN